MLRKISLMLLLVFVGMQFIRPAKNLPTTDPVSDDLFTRHNAPVEVRRAVENACYDCHSNRTRYPWYAEIQPGGWLLARHVREGKRLVNFSEFGRLPPKRARHQLEACADELSEGAMPLASYTWIHRDARLTADQIAAVVAWVEETATRMEEDGRVSQARVDGTRTPGME